MKAKCADCDKPEAWHVWCEFCNLKMCESCTKSSDFGHVCEDCLAKIEDGRIDSNGVDRTWTSDAG